MILAHQYSSMHSTIFYYPTLIVASFITQPSLPVWFPYPPAPAALVPHAQTLRATWSRPFSLPSSRVCQTLAARRPQGGKTLPKRSNRSRRVASGRAWWRTLSTRVKNASVQPEAPAPRPRLRSRRTCPRLARRASPSTGRDDEAGARLTSARRARVAVACGTAGRARADNERTLSRDDNKAFVLHTEYTEPHPRAVACCRDLAVPATKHRVSPPCVLPRQRHIDYRLFSAA